MDDVELRGNRQKLQVKLQHEEHLSMEAGHHIASLQEAILVDLLLRTRVV